MLSIHSLNLPLLFPLRSKFCPPSNKMSCCRRCGGRGCSCCCCRRARPRVVYYVGRPCVPYGGYQGYTYVPSYIPVRSCCAPARPCCYGSQGFSQVKKC